MGAAQNNKSFLADVSAKWGGGEAIDLLENVCVVKKCLECSETQEYAEKMRNFCEGV